MNELYHHGILGQKWGVRRYQNKDGSLTPAGLKQMQKHRREETELDSKIKKNKDDQRKSAGISSNDEYDVIKKGSNLTRQANSNEKLDSRVKYVSLTRDDNEQYSSMSDALRADMSKTMSTYTYQATKDIKVASGKKVLDDVVNTYGDEKIKRLFSEASEIGPIDRFNSDKSMSKWERKYLDESNKARSDFLKTIMKEKQDEIVKKYKDQKYDAIVDIEDWYTGFADYPVVFLDPSKTMRLKKEQKWD